MSMLDDVINGTGQVTTLAPGYTLKGKAPDIVCQDGTTLSVQASCMHYCEPEDDDGPYSEVEVGRLSTPPPQSWAPYADGGKPVEEATVFAYVPVKLVREFVELHGGEVPCKE